MRKPSRRTGAQQNESNQPTQVHAQKDQEMVEFAREEIAELQGSIASLEESIKLMLLPKWVRGCGGERTGKRTQGVECGFLALLARVAAAKWCFEIGRVSWCDVWWCLAMKLVLAAHCPLPLCALDTQGPLGRPQHHARDPGRGGRG